MILVGECPFLSNQSGYQEITISRSAILDAFRTKGNQIKQATRSIGLQLIDLTRNNYNQ